MPTTLKDFLSELVGEMADNRVANFDVEDNYDNYSFADFTEELEEMLEQKQEEDEEVCEHARFLQDYNEQRSLYDEVENLIINHLYMEGEIAACDCCSDTHTKYHIVGQCLDGKCPDSVDSLCDDCGKWDYKVGVWRCSDCQEKHVKEEEEEDNMEDCDCCGYTHHSEDKCPNEATAKHYVNWRKEEEDEDNDYCPICDVLTNTKNCAASMTCCKCQEDTFCDKCVEEYEGEGDCSHDWETHHICAKCQA